MCEVSQQETADRGQGLCRNRHHHTLLVGHTVSDYWQPVHWSFGEKNLQVSSTEDKMAARSESSRSVFTISSINSICCIMDYTITDVLVLFLGKPFLTFQVYHICPLLWRCWVNLLSLPVQPLCMPTQQNFTQRS